ncbi:angiopoietin-related protein 1-like [Stomoxys calcitrans]|uniref:angiopoietin-related protein 1-like n=1 Tax=Stomoxys calcitrans TaxID=35570 RepID=UPI0027E2FCE5|nr:angiopoietin-related protein 1-like [Stomoxys calcitrans]
MLLGLMLCLFSADISLTTAEPSNFQNDDSENQRMNHNIQELHSKINDLERQMKELSKVVDEKCLKGLDSNDGVVVIQRRMDGSVDFSRTWAEYKEGFGNISGEFFIGLETLHKLTNARPYQLFIIMDDWEGDRRVALYDFFVVGSEEHKYGLLSLGTYSGSAGDALSYHLGKNFTTKDQDNERRYENWCPLGHGSGWWHMDCNPCNLNGPYLKGKVDDNIHKISPELSTKKQRFQSRHVEAIVWDAFKGSQYSLKFVEMIIRPR